jgi:hypothetical protein
MPRTPIAQTIVELETLARSITEEVMAEVPSMERSHVKLQGLTKEIRKLLARRDRYQALKQEATRKAHAHIRQAKATATLLRRHLKVHYGPENEQLAAFNINPFRGRKRRKKAEKKPSRKPG